VSGNLSSERNILSIMRDIRFSQRCCWRFEIYWDVMKRRARKYSPTFHRILAPSSSASSSL